jgi:NADPH:quinone reductase
MSKVRRSTIVDAPIDEVWAILRDFNGHDQWHPVVTTSDIEGGLASDMIGAVRDFQLTDGSRIKEQLLSLSDFDHSFSYCILEAPIPLFGYVANVRLRPVTDKNQTFWEWRCTFEPPAHREKELTKIVSDEIYEAGFRAIKNKLRGNYRAPNTPLLPSARQSMSSQAISAQPDTEAMAAVMERHGGPEVLHYQAVRVAAPSTGEVRIRQTAIGVNYIDIYCRTGYFDLIKLPGIPGMEAAGFIESVGPGVSEFKPGDRVAYACAPPGSYTNLRVMPADRLVRLPDSIDDQKAAASLLKGTTASFLVHDVYSVKPGDMVLVHAASGGVGLLLCQWASSLGATVIGTTSSAEKAERASAAGCSYVLDYTREDFAAQVLDITGGRGVDVVYDAVGLDTFERSLRCLKPRGHLVSFGQASGDIGAYEIGKLASRSVTLSRPNYAHFTETSEDILRHAARLFGAVSIGSLRLESPTQYSLSEAARAHSDFESRRTIGSLVLVP